MDYSICIIGAGNLATHLSQALNKNGFNISQIYSRTHKNAKELAEKLKTKFTSSVDEIDKNADIYFVALKDSAVTGILSQIEFNNKLIIHCSGSLPISVLSDYSDNIGVFYPMQTFSKNRELNFESIPVFIESNSESNLDLLTGIAEKISNSVTVLGSTERRNMHIAAVFACNFVNHLYTISAEILKRKGISFEVLQPLILETAKKVQKLDPVKAQTGPAVRFDQNIISTHIKELDGLENYDELYTILSKSIFDYHSKLNK